ncbi:MAG: PKD domain-containing protein [Bacteroidetes bacterium]|nr:PKD domain-containing protein [Bacteroidota bacterium]
MFALVPQQASTPVTHTYKFAGTYKVMYKVITAQGCVDSTTVTITVNQTPATPSVTGASSCNPPAVLKLAAYNAASGLYHLWYNNATTDTVVTAGDTLTTPSISSSKTYYVKAVTMAGLGFVGRAARGVFNGNQNNSNGLRFKVFKTVFIDSMVVYPNASGMFYLVFTDSTTGLKDSMPITVKVATANALTWIYVKKFILPGVYTITASQPASGGTGGFSRSTFAGTAFPYTIPNYITIQGNTTASTTNYLFFYNWHVSAIGCESNRAAVTATIGTGSKPVAKFSAANGCINTSISFKDASTVSTGSIAAYQYDFGDGSSLYNSTSTGNTTHTYTASGTYKVLATVTSSGGCYDTTSRMVTVYANPVVNFGASSSCLSFPVKFTDSSTLNAASATYSWVFEVGKTATIQNPSYTYGSSGTKTVTLTLTNSNGCIVARTKAVNVLADPSAKFSSSIVSGKTYSFTPNDTNLANYIWKFGDGNTSTSKKPNYTYATTGTYTVKLSVDNGQGCTAIDSTTIVITALEGSNENFSLAVSPNPFSTQTTISYSLAKATNLRISLMDITGRQIALLNDGVQTQGTYNTTISANNYHLSAGIYMVRFELDGKTVVRQIVKLRE